MRLIFCGTPEFAVPSLQRLAAEADLRIEAVVTQPDRPRGRGGRVQASAVKEAALAAGLHVYQPEKIKSDSAFDFIERLAPDAVVIIAYGQIIPVRLLAIPRLGWINLHASLLPKYRGAAPIPWAIANGETRTGLTTMQIDPGLDTGPTLLRWETAIGPDETTPELSARLAQAGAPLVLDTLRQLHRGVISPQPQDHSQASLAPLLKKEDGRLDWQQPAPTLYNRIRAFQPWPGAHSTFRGQLCRIWGRPGAPPPDSLAPAPGGLVESPAGLFVACGQSTLLRLEHVQLEGRQRLAAADFARGARLRPDDHFPT
jgi:methionyl-tRNA formyltransferase